MRTKLVIAAVVLLLIGGGAFAYFKNAQRKSQYTVLNGKPEEVLAPERRYRRDELEAYVPPEPRDEREPLEVVLPPEPEQEIEEETEPVIVEVPSLLPLPEPDFPEILEPKVEPDPIYPLEVVFEGSAKVVQKAVVSKRWAPSHRLLHCRLVTTIETRNLASPIIALTTEDLYHHGKLIIPANTEIHGTVNGERDGDRVTASDSWRFVFGPGPDNGKELPFEALVLHRAVDSESKSQELSAGFQGRLLDRDPQELQKLFGYTAIREGYDLATAAALEELDNGDNNVRINNTSASDAPVDRWLDRQFSRLGNDPYYLRVTGGTAFYLYTLAPLDVANAAIGASENSGAGNGNPLADPISTLKQTIPQFTNQIPNLP